VEVDMSLLEEKWHRIEKEREKLYVKIYSGQGPSSPEEYHANEEKLRMLQIESDAIKAVLTEERARAYRAATVTAPAMAKGKETFPNRAAWLKMHMQRLRVTPHRLKELGGPNNKTIKRILDGKFVQEHVLTKLAEALSALGSPISVEDIPSD
jgi:hypothetical protein